MSIEVRGRVLSVNLARVQPNPDKRGEVLTGIEKVPTSEPVLVRAPGSKRDGRGGGLVGDTVCDRRNHGGDTQAVYALPGRTSTTGSPSWSAPSQAACSARTSQRQGLTSTGR